MAGPPSTPPAELKLTPDDVRLITLQAQGLIGAQARTGGVPGMLRRLGAVQLDTISVLARSHELVAYARLGALPRSTIERAYWHPRAASAFEYWSHAACVLPIEEWPYYSFRRRAFRARGMRWHRSHASVCAEVLARLRSDGPLTATQLGGAKNGGAWWDWSDTKIAVEWLLDTGDVICARRTGWRRVYDLPERVLSAELLHADPSDEECLVHLAKVAAQALGVVTKSDLSDYQRVKYHPAGRGGSVMAANDIAFAAGLVAVEIDSGTGPPIVAWADPGAMASLSAADQHNAMASLSAADQHSAMARPGTADQHNAMARLSAADQNNAMARPGTPGGSTAPQRPGGRGRHRVTLLSPFDSLIWDRRRTLRVFGFQHSLEAYVPRERRVHGYYSMPLLAGGRLVGRVDPAREGRTLVARQLTLDVPKAAEPMARALVEAATWVGCDNIKLDQVNPSGLESRLRSAMADAEG